MMKVTEKDRAELERAVRPFVEPVVRICALLVDAVQAMRAGDEELEQSIQALADTTIETICSAAESGLFD